MSSVRSAANTPVMVTASEMVLVEMVLVEMVLVGWKQACELGSLLQATQKSRHCRLWRPSGDEIQLK